MSYRGTFCPNVKSKRVCGNSLKEMPRNADPEENKA